MTLIYSRPPEGPATHAFVVGCGHFPHLSGNEQRRVSPPAGARAIARYLREHADSFLAPLASVELFLSDASGDQTFERSATHDPRPDDSVDQALSELVEKGMLEWRDRIKPGDQAFVYLSSHGIVERDLTRFVLLEDVNGDKHKPYRPTINVTDLVVDLPTLDTSASWVFVDACSSRDQQVLRFPEKPEGVRVLNPSIDQLVKVTAKSLSLVGSQAGGQATAPVNGDPPYFTQVLLKGLAGACAEAVDGHGWCISGRQLMYLQDVANATFEGRGIVIQAIREYNNHSYLTRVGSPVMPVLVRTSTEVDMVGANGTATNGRGDRFDKPVDQITWLFEVVPDGVAYETSIVPKDTNVKYRAKSFYAMPPGKVITMQR